MSEQTVRLERTNWRDISLSTWHRGLGWDTPCCDVDALFGETITEIWLEFDRCVTTFGVEYKCRSDFDVTTFDINSAAIRTQVEFCNAGSKPFMIVLYQPDYTFFTVKLHNNFAVERVKKFSLSPDRINSDWFVLDEYNFVRLLYLMRGRKASPNILENRYKHIGQLPQIIK